MDDIPIIKGNFYPVLQSLLIVYAALVLLIGIFTFLIKRNLSGNFSIATPREYQKRIDWAAYISFALIALSGIALLTEYFFPISPDEIQVHFWLYRLPYDFPGKISGAPTCSATFLQPIPSTMYLQA